MIATAVRAGTSLKIESDFPGDLNEFAVDLIEKADANIEYLLLRKSESLYRMIAKARFVFLNNSNNNVNSAPQYSATMITKILIFMQKFT